MTGIVFDFNCTLYNPQTQDLYPGTLDLLRYLKSKDYKMFIIGKGGEEKKNLVNQLNIQSYFDEIILLPEKSLNDFDSLKERHPEINTFYSIGDRTKKDIKYSNQAGFKTIWFKQGKFADELPEGKDEEPWKTISNLEEVKNLIDEEV